MANSALSAQVTKKQYFGSTRKTKKGDQTGRPSTLHTQLYATLIFYIAEIPSVFKSISKIFEILCQHALGARRVLSAQHCFHFKKLIQSFACTKGKLE